MHFKILNVLFLICPPTETEKRKSFLLFSKAHAMALRLLINNASLFFCVTKAKQAAIWQGDVEFAMRTSLKYSSALSVPSPVVAPTCGLSLGPSPGALVTAGEKMKGSGTQLWAVPQATEHQKSPSNIFKCMRCICGCGEWEEGLNWVNAWYTQLESLVYDVPKWQDECVKVGPETPSAVSLPIRQTNATGLGFHTRQTAKEDLINFD